MSSVPRREKGRKSFNFSSSNDASWAPDTAANQRNIGGSAVRTEGNPWEDSDGGDAHRKQMASDAWKGAGL